MTTLVVIPAKREAREPGSITTALTISLDLCLWIPGLPSVARDDSRALRPLRAELAGLAEAPEIARHDRFHGGGLDAERGQRAALGHRGV